MSEGLASEPVLTAQGVGVRRGRREVLQGIDLSVSAGEIVAVLGPNGAGKSTLLHALGGILPSTGTIRRAGRTATVLQSASLARRTAYANVELATSWARLPRAGRRERVLDAMRLMQVDHLATRSALSLSGGEQRRVHLARAIAVAPEVLLLDEPFDGLDPHTHEQLREDAAQALRASGSGVVVVLHDRRDAWAVADRIAVLIDGGIRAIAPTDQLLNAPPTVQVARFLGYNGELHRGGSVLLTRPTHVRLEADGELRGTIVRRYPTEDGVRLQLHTDSGDVWALHHSLTAAVGSEVRFAVRGGVEFPAG